MSNSKPVSPGPGPIEQFLHEYLASLTTKCATAPLELVKICLQCQPELVRAGLITTAPFSGVFAALSHTIKEGGILALWRGNTVWVMQGLVAQLFTASGISARLRGLSLSRSNFFLWLLSTSITGAVAGTLTLIVTYPLEYARTQLACDMSHRFTGTIDVLQKTIETDGVRAIYRGVGVSALGIVLYRAAYFGLYDSFSFGLLDRRSARWRFFYGWAMTIAAGLITYPIDTVRRRMMVSLCSPLPYSSASECTREILSKEGLLSFWNGAGVNIVRSVAGAFAIYFADRARDRYVQWRYPPPPPPPPQYTYEEQQTQ